jgi:DNA-binding GntR family transcriptional regulator
MRTGMRNVDGSMVGVDGVDHPHGVGDASGATPRYLQLARTLQNAINGGAYPVGSLLPTELDLAAQHGVSRQTVRQAIGQLRNKGLLSARKGVGTRVDARYASKRFTYSVLSETDLVEIAEGTEMTVLDKEWVVARGALAAELGCRANHRWLRLGGLRRVDGDDRPLAWVTVHIDGRLAPALRIPDVVRTALFLLLERHSGESLVEIQQEIRATVVEGLVAERLDVAAGTPALEITRRFFSTGRRLVLVSVNVLPADRFFYSVSIAREEQGSD